MAAERPQSGLLGLLRRLRDRLMLRYSARAYAPPRIELDASTRQRFDDIARGRTRRWLFPDAFERAFQDHVRASMSSARLTIVLFALSAFATAPMWSPPMLNLPPESLPLTRLVCYGIVTPVFMLAAWMQVFRPVSAWTEFWVTFAFLVEVVAIEGLIYATDATGFKINASMAVSVPVAVLPITRIRLPSAILFGAAYFIIVGTRESFWPGLLTVRSQTDWLLEAVLVACAVASVAFSRLSLRRGWAANILLDASASTDAMTGLPNRAAFEAHFQRYSQLVQRRRTSAVMALVDLDHFKKINDRYGHPYGDGVLVEFAMILTELARLPGDMAARLGGEEFGLFLFECNAENGRARLEEFLEKLRRLGIEHADSEFRIVTASIGAVVVTSAGEFAAAYHAADKLLYEAKQAGRNRLQIASLQSP